MLKPASFAHSLAVVAGGSYLVFAMMSLVAPGMFATAFNAQFMGANVAALVPASSFSFIEVVKTGVSIMLSSWLFAYLWAWFYNYLEQ